MRKLILIGMAFAMIAGFSLGCEQPPQGPDNGNYQDQQAPSDPYQEQQDSAPQTPGYDN